MILPHAQVYFVSAAAAREQLSAVSSTVAVTIMERDRWGIDDSRSLVDEVFRTSATGAERLIAIIASDFTMEAQNALLKIIEEPPAGTSIHFFVPPGTTLLPNIYSRVQVVSGLVDATTALETFATWRALPLPEQLSMVETRTKNKDEAWIAAVTTGALITVRALAPTLSPTVAAGLLYALERVGTRGASNKMLLDEVVLLFSHVDKQGTIRPH